jgi:hypothetical protein
MCTFGEMNLKSFTSFVRFVPSRKCFQKVPPRLHVRGNVYRVDQRVRTSRPPITKSPPYLYISAPVYLSKRDKADILREIERYTLSIVNKYTSRAVGFNKSCKKFSVCEFYASRRSGVDVRIQITILSVIISVQLSRYVRLRLPFAFMRSCMIVKFQCLTITPVAEFTIQLRHCRSSRCLVYNSIEIVAIRQAIHLQLDWAFDDQLNCGLSIFLRKMLCAGPSIGRFDKLFLPSNLFPWSWYPTCRFLAWTRWSSLIFRGSSMNLASKNGNLCRKEIATVSSFAFFTVAAATTQIWLVAPAEHEDECDIEQICC